MWPWNLIYELKQCTSEGFDSCDRPSNLKLNSNRQFFRPCDREFWWISDLEKQWGTSSILRQALCIISNPLVNSNWIYSPETLNSGRNWWPWNLMDDLKTIGHLFYDTLSFVHHSNAIGKFKLKLQSGNAQFGSKSTIFLAEWPRNFNDDPEKQ